VTAGGKKVLSPPKILSGPRLRLALRRGEILWAVKKIISQKDARTGLRQKQGVGLNARKAVLRAMGIHHIEWRRKGD